MRTLKEIYQNYSYPEGNGDKGTCHNYIETYERLLTPYRESGDILEIGVSWGYSLRMWREYFVKGAVTGIDIVIEENARDLLSDSRYNIINCDATSPIMLNYLTGLTFDVIIDDGSHFLEHQLTTFDLLKSYVKPNGLYIIEDIVDIDSHKDLFSNKHYNCEIVDTRHINDRYDDVLVIYRF